MKKNNSPSSKSTGKTQSRRRKRNNRRNRQRRNAVVGTANLRSRSLGGPAFRGDSGLSLTRSQFTATSPLTSWQLVPASSPGGMRVRGQEQFASCTANITNSNLNFNYYNGGTLASSDSFVAVTPRNLLRMASLSAIYELYRFHRIVFRFVSASPTISVGMLAFGIEYDVNQPLPAAGDFNYVNNHISSTCGNAYSDMSLEVIQDLCLEDRYVCGPRATASGLVDDQRLKYQCEVQGVYNYPSATGGQLFGLLMIEYDVEFFSPRPGISGASLASNGPEREVRNFHLVNPAMSAEKPDEEDDELSKQYFNSSSSSPAQKSLEEEVKDELKEIGEKSSSSGSGRSISYTAIARSRAAGKSDSTSGTSSPDVVRKGGK